MQTTEDHQTFLSQASFQSFLIEKNTMEAQRALAAALHFQLPSADEFPMLKQEDILVPREALDWNIDPDIKFRD